MRDRELHAVERAPRAKGQLREGLRYVAGRPELIWPIVLVGFIGTFGFNFPICPHGLRGRRLPRAAPGRTASSTP